MVYELSIIAVAAVVNMLVGMVWYGPLFGAFWLEERGLKNMSPQQFKKMAEQAAWAYPQAFLGGMLSLYVLMQVMNAFYVQSYIMVFKTVVWMWLGFVVPTMYSGVLWENKSLRLFALNAGYYLVAWTLAGCVLVTLL